MPPIARNVRILNTEVLSDNWYTLRKIAYEYSKHDGTLETQTREAYETGDGATILLYNKEQKTVILTRQFRLPSFINGNSEGTLIEACAGILNNEDAENCIKREVEEETGYRVADVKKIFDAYMSPATVTEILHFFIAPYTKAMKVSKGGGLSEEHENIEVLEMDFDKAMSMVEQGEIKDGKTILLLQYAKLHNII